MSTTIKKTSAQEFRQRTTAITHSMLREWCGEERAAEAVGRISTAISASAAAAKNPDDFYECTPSSVAKVVAISALTGIMPGTGATALAYAIPRRARKGEPPQLQYQLSHRGIAALAKRAGCSLSAIPVSVTDKINVDEVTGDVSFESRDIDNPPLDETTLRGVIVIVRNYDNGSVVGRGWVAKAIINQRRETSDSYQYACKNEWAKQSDPWHKWYVEMAIKTALHYAIGRGWAVIDDTEALRALKADAESDYTVDAESVAAITESVTERLVEKLETDATA